MDEITPHLRVYADQLAREWGRQVWRIWSRGDGWPPRTLLARIMAEGMNGAGHSSWVQVHAEVLTLHGQMVSRALQSLPERPRVTIAIHYVVPTPTARKCRILHIPERTYWRCLAQAKDRLAVELISLDDVAGF